MTIVSQAMWKTLFPQLLLQVSTVSLKAYTSEKLTVVREYEVTVKYNGQTKLLPITIVNGDGPSLLGRNWLEQLLRLDWHRIPNVSQNDQLEDLLIIYRIPRDI